MINDPNQFSREAWDANAEYWDSRMGDEGNDFFKKWQVPSGARLVGLRLGLCCKITTVSPLCLWLWKAQYLSLLGYSYCLGSVIDLALYKRPISNYASKPAARLSYLIPEVSYVV